MQKKRRARPSLPAVQYSFMKTIYFIRHAESEANEQDILASRMDFPLSAKGRADADAIAAEFREMESLDRIVCSPLLRARQTAAPLGAAFGLEVETDDRLTEQELGIYSGMTYTELEDRRDYMHDRTKRWEWVPGGGGESYKMIAERLQPFFRSLDGMDGSRILFVTHAVTMRMIRAILEQTLPEYPHVIAKNGEIWKTAFTRLGEPHVIESIFLGSSADTASRA
jgi:broad specificity phosphatase PhoE